jgi:hypothetical protein
MTRVVIQKHCEVLALNPDPKEKDTYDVEVLLTKGMEEFVPEIPIKLKGSSQEIAKILSFLGEEFNRSNALEHDLDDLSIAPITFEMKGTKVVAKDTHGKELLNKNIHEGLSIEKVKEFTEKFFLSHKQKTQTSPTSELLIEVEKVRSLWGEINTHRTTKQQRVEKKVSLLQEFIRQVARQKGMPEEEIERGLEELKDAKSLNDFLNRAKLQYFPALSEELHALQNCEECKDHLRLV